MKVLLLCFLLLCIYSIAQSRLLDKPKDTPESLFCDQVSNLFPKKAAANGNDCKKSRYYCALTGVHCSSDKIIKVDWSGKGLSSIPSTLWGLPDLKTVVLSENPLSSLEFDGAMDAPIANFSISGCQFNQYPTLINSFNSLESLDMSYNSLSGIPASIWSFSSLQYLDLSGNPLTTLPSVSSLREDPEVPLIDLKMSHCALSSYPSVLAGFSSLKSASFSYNGITTITSNDIPQSFERLDLSHNKMSSFPDSYSVEELLLDHNCFENCVGFPDALKESCNRCEQMECDGSGSAAGCSSSSSPSTSSGSSSSSSPSPSSSSSPNPSSSSSPSPSSSSSPSPSSSSSPSPSSSSSPSPSSSSSSSPSSSSNPTPSSSLGPSSSSSSTHAPNPSPVSDSSSSSGHAFVPSSSFSSSSSSRSDVDSQESLSESSQSETPDSSDHNSSSEKTVSISSSSVAPAGGSLVWVYIAIPVCAVALIAIILFATPLRRKVTGGCAGGRRNDNMSIVVDGEELTVSLGKEIGKGSFGTVWLAQSGTLTLAAKEMARRTDESENEYKKEMEIMSHLDSPYVVRVYGSVVTDESYFIAMEYIPLGSLSVVTKNYYFSPFMRSRFMLDVARGMEYLHGRGVIHRDLKPANVLVSSIDPESEVLCKITDFGASRQGLEDTNTMTMTCGIGSPYYMSPEMLRGDQKYTRAVDVYSFGIMGAELWNQKQPFSEVHFDTPFAFARYVLEGHRPAVQSDCPPDLAEVFNHCWEADRLDRPPFATVVKDLEPIVERLKKTTPEGTEHVTVREDAECDNSSGSKGKTKGRKTGSKSKTKTKTKTRTKTETQSKKKVSHKPHNSTDKSVSISPSTPLADESSVSLSPLTPVSPSCPSFTPPNTTAPSANANTDEIPLDDLADGKLVSSENK